MAGVLQAIDTVTGKAEKLYCENGKLLVKIEPGLLSGADAAAYAEAGAQSAETRQEAPAEPRARRAENLEDPQIVFPTNLPGGGARAVQLHAGTDPSQIAAVACQLHTVEITNLAGEDVVVRFLDCRMASSKHVAQRSLKRRGWLHKRSNSVAPAPDIEIQEMISASLEEGEAALAESRDMGNLEHAVLSWVLNPSERYTFTYPAGVSFRHGLVAQVRRSDASAETQKVQVHVQVTITA
mgnify:CR=1 FL=1|nr:hypothetical protein [Nitrosomonas nitrosa]